MASLCCVRHRACSGLEWNSGLVSHSDMVVAVGVHMLWVIRVHSDIRSWYFPAVVNELARLRLVFKIGLETMDSSICLWITSLKHPGLGAWFTTLHCIFSCLITAYDLIPLDNKCVIEEHLFSTVCKCCNSKCTLYILEQRNRHESNDSRKQVQKHGMISTHCKCLACLHAEWESSWAQVRFDMSVFCVALFRLCTQNGLRWANWHRVIINAVFWKKLSRSLFKESFKKMNDSVNTIIIIFFKDLFIFIHLLESESTSTAGKLCWVNPSKQSGNTLP